MGRADDMSYIGEYLHISNIGIISNWDIYPASHIFGASIAIISGMQSSVVSFIIPIVFSSLFVFGTNIHGNKFYKNTDYRNILIVSSFVLYLGMYNFLNTPHALFFAFLPIYLFIIFNYVQHGTTSYAIMMVLFSLLIPFTHPFILFFVIAFQLSLLLFKRFIKNLITGDISRLRNIVIIQLTAFASWFLYSSSLLGSFGRAVNSFLLKLTEPVLTETTDKIVKIGPDLSSFIPFVLIYYGRFIIPTVLIIVFLFLYYNRIKHDAEQNRIVKLLFVAYLITLIIEAILFLNPLISHVPDRMTNLLFLVYFQIPAFTLLSIIYINNYKIKSRIYTIKKFSMISVVILIFSLSLLGALPSPMVYSSNFALTNNEVAGMKWVYDFRDSDNMAAPLSQIGRFHTLFDDGLNDDYIGLSDHFGYDNTNKSLAQSITDNSGSLYIVKLTIDVTLYEEVPGYSNIGRYNYQDYYRLNCDDSVINIYSSKNIGISYLM